MRAIVIDPARQTVEEIDTDGSLKVLQQIVGGHIEMARVDADHHCYVNEEGLLQQPRNFFQFTDGHQPLAGRGIILAGTSDGGEGPCSLSVDWVRDNVTFMDLDATLEASDDPMFHALAVNDYQEPANDNTVSAASKTPGSERKEIALPEFLKGEDAARRDYLKELALTGIPPEIDDLTEDEGLWLAEIDARDSYEDELQTRREAELSSSDQDNGTEPER